MSQMAEMDRKEAIFKAKIAKKASRYDDMVIFMKFVANQDQELNHDERELFFSAHQHAVDTRRTSWKQMLDYEKELVEGDEEIVMAKKYRDQVAQEVSDLCNVAIQLLDNKLIPNAQRDSAKVQYLRLKGDFYRYMAEVSNQKTDIANKSKEAYADAWKVAEYLKPIHPARLQLSLNFSVFYDKIMNDPNKAREIATKACESTKDEMEKMLFELWDEESESDESEDEESENVDSVDSKSENDNSENDEYEDDQTKNCKSDDDTIKNGKSEDDSKNVIPEDDTVKTVESEDDKTKNGKPVDDSIKNSLSEDDSVKNDISEDDKTKNGKPVDDSIKNGEPEDDTLKNDESEDDKTKNGLSEGDETEDGTSEDGDSEDVDSEDELKVSNEKTIEYFALMMYNLKRLVAKVTDQEQAEKTYQFLATAESLPFMDELLEAINEQRKKMKKVHDYV